MDGKRKSRDLDADDSDNPVTSSKKQKKSPRKNAEPKNKQTVQDESDLEEDIELEEPVSDEEGGVRIGDIYIPPPPPVTSGVNQSGPRLIITHIENEFFKSYAEKTVLGPFHKCFTAIVGPNGSGKSNVIDSMLFVFGYRASKIRSKKLSVLLHNSNNYRDIRSCTVSVHFKEIIDKPGDEYEEVPGSDLCIARTAFRDNSSFYTINGKRCQFKEVSKLLRSFGIDLDHNRFLILQGEVEQISLMKPKAPNEHETGMLEYLEDIIGTSRYKEPIEKLYLLVENLIEQRTEKLNRVKMVEKEKDSLEGPMKEALKALKTENRLAKTKHLHFQKYIRDLQISITKYEAEKQQIDDELKDRKEELAEIQEKVKAKEDFLKEKDKETRELRQQKESLNEEFKNFENQDIQLTADIQQSNQKRKKMQEQLKEEEKKLKTLERIPEKNKNEIQELKKREPKLVEEHEKQQKELDKVIATIAQEASSLTEKKEKLENQLVGLTATADEQRSKRNVAQKELDIYLQAERTSKKRLEDLQAAYDDTNQKIQNNQKTISELKKKIPGMQKELKSMEEEVGKTTKDEGAVSQKLREKTLALEEAKSNQQATTSRNGCLDFLMKHKRNGNIPGIIGRLGDLGGIDEKYDVAVSTCCPALDNILVDTVDTGQLCIDYLKKHDVGRANFIVLDKQEHLRAKANEKINTPENVPRLYDLVRVSEERLKTAFYYALRDTLVADDLEQATRIGYGRVRHRVVTLKGEVIEPSGSMTGGGRQQIRGRMGRDSRRDVGLSDREIAAMRDEVQVMQDRSQKLTDKINELNRQIRTHTQVIATDKHQLEMAEMELQTLSKQLPEMKTQIKQQNEKAKESIADPKHVKKLESKLASIQEDVDKAEEAEGKVKSKVTDLAKEIEKNTAGRVKSAQKKVREAHEQLDIVQSEIVKLGVAIKTSERDAQKSNDKIASLKQDLEELRTKIVQMVESKEKNKCKADKVNAKYIASGTELMDKEESLKEVKAELDKILLTENKLKKKKMDIDEKMSSINDYITEKQRSINKHQAQLEKLTLHVLPGEEQQDEFQIKSLEELDAMNADNLQYEVAQLDEMVAKNKPNFGVIEAFKRKESQYLQRVEELESITNKRNEMRTYYDDIRKKRLNEFMAGFTVITEKLKEMYQMITLGGDAELELVDSLDPFVEGIVFSVRPPKKSWKNISNLSGGEKTLSSLALVFALHYYKPTPLYVMDEIDAALDFKNVSIVANYIKERTKNAQFIIISLRSNMFELADTLVGIYKTHNTTKTATINPKVYDTKDAPIQSTVVSSQNMQNTQELIDQTANLVSQATKDKPPEDAFDSLLA